MDIICKVRNPYKRDIAVKGNLYFKTESKTRGLSLDKYKSIKNDSELDIEIVGVHYDKLESLNKEELQIVAEYEGIDNYWSKNKSTLITDIKNEIEGKEVIKEEEGE